MKQIRVKEYLPEGRLFYVDCNPDKLSDNDVEYFIDRLKKQLKIPGHYIDGPVDMSLMDRISLCDARAANALKNQFYEAARLHIANSIKYRAENIINNFC